MQRIEETKEPRPIRTLKAGIKTMTKIAKKIQENTESEEAFVSWMSLNWINAERQSNIIKDDIEERICDKRNSTAVRFNKRSLKRRYTKDDDLMKKLSILIEQFEVENDFLENARQYYYDNKEDHIQKVSKFLSSRNVVSESTNNISDTLPPTEINNERDLVHHSDDIQSNESSNSSQNEEEKQRTTNNEEEIRLNNLLLKCEAKSEPVAISPKILSDQELQQIKHYRSAK